jgi:uncharacterized protein
MLGSLSTARIDSILRNNITGRIGCTNGLMVYVVPVSYVYDGRYILAHSREGMKIRLMRINPHVCFEVDTVHSPDNWESVVIQGIYEELEDEDMKYQAMKKLVDRMLTLKVSETARPPHISEKRVHPVLPGESRVVIFRIDITEKTGRFEKN